MSEILNYNKQFQSHQMKQGLRDEKAIVKMYENKEGCQVKQLICSVAIFLLTETLRQYI